MAEPRRIKVKPLNEPQTKVLVTKEGHNTQPSDFGIRCARVRQEALTHLNDGGVIDHNRIPISGQQAQ
jgi:hypothetical protein